MNKVIKNAKSLIFSLSITAFFLMFSGFSYIKAECLNTIPNPLNPDCIQGRNDISVGGLTNRFIGVMPIVITIITVIAIARGAIKIILADDPEKRAAGFKGIINATLGAVVFYSIWVVLFLIEYFTGAELIPFKI